MMNRAKNNTHANGAQGSMSDVFCSSVILSSSTGWNLAAMWPKSVVVVTFFVLREPIHVPFGIV
jgi:hypothetical protein